MKVKQYIQDWQRSQSGFSLPTIVCLGVCVGLVLVSTAQLLNVTATKVTKERLTDIMRASAESGLDWAVQQLSDESTRADVDTGSDIVIPSDYLHPLPGSSLTGTVRVLNLLAPKTSYLYSDRLDPSVAANNITGGVGGWRVVTATVTNGVKSKSVRVMLKPVYDTFTDTIISTTGGTALVNGNPTPLFVKSLFAKGAIAFHGAPSSTDSWDSATGGTNPGTFHTGTAGQGDVGSNTSASIGNGTVNGEVVVTAGEGTGSVSVNNASNITGGTSTSGTGPTGSTILTGSAATPQVLPDAPSAPSNAVSLGPISLSGHSQLTLAAGNYIVNSLSIAGQGQLNLPSTGIVNIYVQGSGTGIQIGGNGITNPSGYPSNLRIWYSGSTQVQIGGNGVLKGVVYAPNANLQFNGNGTMYGAAVGNGVTVNGNSTFHYDEALGTSTQLTYIPQVVTTTTSTTTSTTIVHNIKNFQAVSWMEF